MRTVLCTVSGSKPAAMISACDLRAFDVAHQNAIEHVVRGQRILIGLIRAQFGRRRPLDHCTRNDFTFPRSRAPSPESRFIPPPRQPVHLRLVNVLQRRIRAAHVAVQRGVPDRHFALVAGGEQQRAALVGQRHQQHAARARLQILLREIGRLVPAASRLQRAHESFECRFDREVEITHAQSLRLRVRPAQRQLRGVA